MQLFLLAKIVKIYRKPPTVDIVLCMQGMNILIYLHTTKKCKQAFGRKSLTACLH